MSDLNRRAWLRSAGIGSLGAITATRGGFSLGAPGAASSSDSLPTQLYKSLNEQQRRAVCLPANHPRRQYVSNWWYIHPEHRIPSTFNREQQELIRKIFDSLHSADYRDAVNQQVLIDQYGEVKNAPAAGFFGSPDDADFEFIFTGHHVTRRCNAHVDSGKGFGGNPIFYGHYPHPANNSRENFNEASDHPGNPYWYQGKLFNRFVESLNGKQQQAGLVSEEPRGEEPEVVVKRVDTDRGLDCSSLAQDQKKLLLETMRGMLAMFRTDDISATMDAIEKQNVVDRLHVSWYSGKYDIGSDKVWDTWQIEGPDLVWYYRGYPHIHCYFHLKT